MSGKRGGGRIFYWRVEFIFWLLDFIKFVKALRVCIEESMITEKYHWFYDLNTNRWCVKSVPIGYDKSSLEHWTSIENHFSLIECKAIYISLADLKRARMIVTATGLLSISWKPPPSSSIIAHFADFWRHVTVVIYHLYSG